MLTDETAPIEEVAAALGKTEDWLRRRWLKHHLETGFPRKLPDCWVWPRAAVAAWLRGGGASAPQLAASNDNPALDRDAAYRAALDAHYGGRP
jgi:hypothetical protein